MELTFRAVRAAGLVYDWEDDCGVAPNELNLLGEVFRGGVQTGDLCWSVRTDDIASLFIFVEEAFSFSDARLWLALAPRLSSLARLRCSYRCQTGWGRGKQQ